MNHWDSQVAPPTQQSRLSSCPRHLAKAIREPLMSHSLHCCMSSQSGCRHHFQGSLLCSLGSTVEEINARLLGSGATGMQDEQRDKAGRLQSTDQVNRLDVSAARNQLRTPVSLPLGTPQSG